jgi:hypothetical protein
LSLVICAVYATLSEQHRERISEKGRDSMNLFETSGVSPGRGSKAHSRLDITPLKIQKQPSRQMSVELCPDEGTRPGTDLTNAVKERA